MLCCPFRFPARASGRLPRGALRSSRIVASLAASRGRGEVDSLAGHDSVENVGIEIGAVRPNDRAEVRVDSYLRKARWIAQGGEESVPADDSVEVRLALDAVGKAQVETVISGRSSLSDVYEHISF
jgi:hypothetical protein